jgi:DnaA-like protein
MTTMLLPADEVAKIRALKGLAYVLAVMILLDRRYPGRAFRPGEIALIAGLDERTVAKQLKDLSVLDRVILSGSGYVLTQGGRGLFLAPVEIEALAPSPDSTQAPQVQAPDLDLIPAATAEPPEILTIDGTHTPCVLLEEELNQLNNSDLNSSSSDSSTQSLRKPSQPTTLQILDATTVLFGKTMTTAGLETRSRRAAIGWVAQAYDQRRHLSSPQGLIYRRLLDDKLPQQKYYDHPRDFLPNEYLAALGLEPRKAQPQPTEPDPDPEPEVHWHCAPAQVSDVGNDAIHESVNQPCPNTHITPARAWQSTLEQLSSDMHRAPFDTWVKGTQAVRFDGATLFIGARNSYTCDWLQSRLQSTVERLLVGIMNQSVDVKFVVTQLEKED